MSLSDVTPKFCEFMCVTLNFTQVIPPKLVSYNVSYDYSTKITNKRKIFIGKTIYFNQLTKSPFTRTLPNPHHHDTPPPIFPINSTSCPLMFLSSSSCLANIPILSLSRFTSSLKLFTKWGNDLHKIQNIKFHKNPIQQIPISNNLTLSHPHHPQQN